MSSEYADYTKDRVGFFFGMTGPQLATVMAAGVPLLIAVGVHDGPPRGARLTRVALIQDHAAQTWAATARIVHPGIGIAEGRERDRMGEGLAQLQEVLARTDLARMLVIQVRTVPDDGAERAQWVAKNRRADSPALSRRVNDDLAVSLTAAG